MDVGVFLDLMIGILILLGVCSIIGGIIKLVKSKKEQKGTGYKIKVILLSVFKAVISFYVASYIHTTISGIAAAPMVNYPSSIENITYGQAFDIACEDIKWSGASEQIGEEGGNKFTFIQMDGKYTYGGEKHDIIIQFRYKFGVSFDEIDESMPFQISFVGLDGDNEAYEDDMEDIIYSMFKMYADENEIYLDESVKDGILYTEGWEL